MSNLLKVRCDGYEMVDNVGEIFTCDFYLIGNPRMALRKQIALAAVYHKPAGDEWWVGREAFEPIKSMKTVEERLAFLQAEVDKDAEHLAKRVEQASKRKEVRC